MSLPAPDRTLAEHAKESAFTLIELVIGWVSAYTVEGSFYLVGH